jgi:hypothetical protein
MAQSQVLSLPESDGEEEVDVELLLLMEVLVLVEVDVLVDMPYWPSAQLAADSLCRPRPVGECQCHDAPSWWVLIAPMNCPRPYA